jgi:hypothetical protein
MLAVAVRALAGLTSALPSQDLVYDLTQMPTRESEAGGPVRGPVRLRSAGPRVPFTIAAGYAFDSVARKTVRRPRRPGQLPPPVEDSGRA